MTLAAARADVKAALAALSGIAVYEGPPSVMSPPCVVLRPGDPWLGTDGTVTLRLDCTVRMVGPRLPVLVRLENLVELVLAELAAGGFSPDVVRPGDEDPAGATYTATIEVNHRDC